MLLNKMGDRQALESDAIRGGREAGTFIRDFGGQMKKNQEEVNS